MSRAFLTSASRATSVTSAATVISAVLVGVSACSSSDRAPFEDPDAGATPSEQPQQAAPSKSSQDEPVNTESDAGPAVVPCADLTPGAACGLFPQCGCAANETCDVADLSGAVRCIAAGRAPMGSPCTSTAGCVRGTSCVFGTCHALCGNAGATCTEAKTGTCFQVKGTNAAPIPNFQVCSVKCDPRDATACGGSTAAGTGVCVVGDDGSTDCQKGGTRADHQSCSATDDCGPGLVCTTVTSGGTTTNTCRRWCQVGKSDCGSGKTCSGFGTAVKIDGIEYGVCP
ncbi:hypothetical protein [Labilithrix luteola]|uniref:hypothetical protein n=1 Tax=Labilithrix luteola TaxID=1391654 RepID=UPI0011BA9DC9|nr:hypothetical protein [Labilithrix luteola]